jgi:hypothetical protein
VIKAQYTKVAVQPRHVFDGGAAKTGGGASAELPSISPVAKPKRVRRGPI